MITCGKREFKSWEEAEEFINDFKQREHERREMAFYYWHNIPIYLIMKICMDAGMNFAMDMFLEEGINILEEGETYKDGVIKQITEKLLNELFFPSINTDISQELHAGHRLPLVSFDTQEEKEEVFTSGN